MKETEQTMNSTREIKESVRRARIMGQGGCVAVHGATELLRAPVHTVRTYFIKWR